MKIIEVLGAFLLMLALMSVAAADVSLDISGYNSDDDMSFSFNAENINYIGLFDLEPHEISFQSAGDSTSPDSHYSLEQTFNRDGAHSSAATNSGSSVWVAQMDTGNGDNLPQKFKIAALHNVDDGFLASEYGNNNIAAHSNAIASKASYSERVAITKDMLFAIGAGATHNQETPNMNNDISIEPIFGYGVFTMSGNYAHGETGGAASEAGSVQVATNNIRIDGSKAKVPTEINNLPGFIQEVDAAGGGDWVHVKNAVIGKGDDATAKWAYGLKSSSDSEIDEYPYTIGLAASGASTEGFKLMAMEGEGSDIPVQSFPPGSLDIKSQTDIDYIMSQNLQYVSQKTNEFYEAYPSPEDMRTTTWYSWNHRAFISIDDINNDNLDSKENRFDYFKMSMRFDVNSDESQREKSTTGEKGIEAD